MPTTFARNPDLRCWINKPTASLPRIIHLANSKSDLGDTQPSMNATLLPAHLDIPDLATYDATKAFDRISGMGCRIC
jgi:hypothetical protein